MNTYGDPEGGSLAYITLVGIIIFVITYIFLEALYYKALNDEQNIKIVERQSVELENLRREQRERLMNYGVQANYEENRSRISIPIDRAIELVLQEGDAAMAGEPVTMPGN